MRDREARKELQAQVMASIVEQMRKDREKGLRPRDEAEKRGIPFSIALEAEIALESEDDEAWWDQVERTIDGEVIRNALANPSA